MILSKKEIPRTEYPRPQFVRSIWFNLNGEWEFAFDDAEEGMSLGWYDGRELPLRINVPCGYQTEHSGNNDKSVVTAAVDAIGPRLDEIFARAKSENVITNEVADAMAKAKLLAAKDTKARAAVAA